MLSISWLEFIPVCYRYFLVVFVLFCKTAGTSAQSVLSPQVSCVAVNTSNGDVTLTWSVPADPGGNFFEYQIYSSPLTPLGPYTQVGTVSAYLQNTFTVVGAGANTQRVYFKVLTSYTPGPVVSAPLDTFSTIFLNVINPGNGTAQLSWNKTSFKSIPGNSTWYRIYREYPVGTWTQIDSTQALTYTDVVDICNAQLNYKIEQAHSAGCVSVSNSAGGTLFTDQTPPAQGQFDTVSVTAAGLAELGWQSSASKDADSVVIYRGNSALGPWLPIVTLPNTQKYYLYPASTATLGIEYYRLAFKDSCSNLSPQGTIHNTIYLSTSFNICSSTASLIWNKYNNMNPGVSQYRIYRSINAGPYMMVASQNANDTTYTDSGLQLGNSYCYFVRALGGSRSSTSNSVCFNAAVTQPPTYHYNRFATVISDNRIDVKAHVDTGATSVKYYNLRRAISGTGSFSTIATFPFTSSTVISYSDTKVNAAINSYDYEWTAMDSCANVITTSNSGTTMLLTGQAGANLDVMLNWNDYTDWQGNVNAYEIYRAVDGVWDPLPIATVAYTGSGGSYTDDISAFLPTSRGIFHYKIIAQEGSGNPYGFSDSSQSNVIRLVHFPKFFFPNTFTPNSDGKNDVFLPVAGFIDPDSYKLTIFDRTGTPIASYWNLAEGWDGKKKGDPCQEGVYMYLVNCKATNGDDVQLYGTVSLIR